MRIIKFSDQRSMDNEYLLKWIFIQYNTYDVEIDAWLRTRVVSYLRFIAIF